MFRMSSAMLTNVMARKLLRRRRQKLPARAVKLQTAVKPGLNLLLLGELLRQYVLSHLSGWQGGGFVLQGLGTTYEQRLVCEGLEAVC